MPFEGQVPPITVTAEPVVGGAPLPQIPAQPQGDVDPEPEPEPGVTSPISSSGLQAKAVHEAVTKRKSFLKRNGRRNH